MDLTEALRAYQAAADYYGKTQAEVADASANYQDTMTAEQNAHRVYEVAKVELLKAARDVKLPRPNDGTRPVKDQPQA